MDNWVLSVYFMGSDHPAKYLGETTKGKTWKIEVDNLNEHHETIQLMTTEQIKEAYGKLLVRSPNPPLALTKALNTAGNLGYILMAIGNVGILVCIFTLGLSNQVVFADTVWAVVLDAGAIYVTWRHYGEKTENIQNLQTLDAEKV